MNYILAILVFCVILFMYLHLQFQMKTSNDLELFEIYDTTKENMEEICDIRQPAIFNNLDDEFVTAVVRKLNVDGLIQKYPQYDVKIREAIKYTEFETKDASSLNNDYASLPLVAANQLMTANSTFYSENNADFLAETNVLKNVSDHMLRPYLTSRCEYDVMFGTEGCTTPLRYDMNYRNFFICTKGTVYIKLVPPKYSKSLNPVLDYDLFEFRSDHNMWLSEATGKSEASQKIKSLEIALTPGKVLFIPAYWWSSFQFGQNASIASFKYRTYVNQAIHLPHYCMCLMQRQNVKKSFAKNNMEDLLFETQPVNVEPELETVVEPETIKPETVVEPEIVETNITLEISETNDEKPKLDPIVEVENEDGLEHDLEPELEPELKNDNDEPKLEPELESKPENNIDV